ncbi:hypothetical protein [Asticcacaulis sp. AC402]|uniref:hypothetical protein n=1 Tax=Asticcacaulis sp. AC402 TaxID=1282361 RepID=UPI0003C40CF3|nr:hypothetical protein [Asticcacaulis sp. AC402]ESQ76853.1 hypothetical protein ABAC402_04100 [Asticcacaulis sp. AC402]
MDHVARILLYFLFAGIALTLIASGLMWWFEATRRLQRALTTALGKPADAIVYDLSGSKAAGLDFTAGDLAVMWNNGAQGLVYAFDEIEGAELIVDERVVARAQRGEPRRVLNETHANASRVTLRLMFDDVETPEFELNLFGEVSHNPVHAKTAAEAVRLGRKWLSHVDAVNKRMPATPAAYPADDDEPVAVAQRTTLPKPAQESTINDPPPWDDDVENDTDDDEKH